MLELLSNVPNDWGGDRLKSGAGRRDPKMGAATCSCPSAVEEEGGMEAELLGVGPRQCTPECRHPKQQLDC